MLEYGILGLIGLQTFWSLEPFLWPVQFTKGAPAFDCDFPPSCFYRSLSLIPCCCCFADLGNPEEGELRPQLLDRFGMHAAIRTVKDPVLRVHIVAERSRFDEDPEGKSEGLLEACYAEHMPRV